MANPKATPDAFLLGPAEAEEIDPELVALPDPPRAERNLTVAVLVTTTVAALFMCGALARDAAFALGSASTLELGDLSRTELDELPSNVPVRGSGLVGAAGGVRYERPFEADSYRLMPVAGRKDLWVELRVPARQETGRFVPPSSFSGRLVRLDQAGLRHRGLLDLASASTPGLVPHDTYLVVDGETPAGLRWAAILAALFFGFAVWNALAAAKLLRRVR